MWFGVRDDVVALGSSLVAAAMAGAAVHEWRLLTVRPELKSGAYESALGGAWHALSGCNVGLHG